jgi:hypothetical protein
MKTKVKEINSEFILFENDTKLYSEHDQDCCESHYLSFEDLTMKDFENLEFDLSNDNFFNRIPDYGIELVPIKGWSVKIPGYGYNNGYYSTNIDLVLSNSDGKEYKRYDVSDCQIIEG